VEGGRRIAHRTPLALVLLALVGSTVVQAGPPGTVDECAEYPGSPPIAGWLNGYQTCLDADCTDLYVPDRCYRPWFCFTSGGGLTIGVHVARATQ
jgi:hypothetical protein